MRERLSLQLQDHFVYCLFSRDFLLFDSSFPEKPSRRIALISLFSKTPLARSTYPFACGVLAQRSVMPSSSEIASHLEHRAMTLNRLMIQISRSASCHESN